MSRPVKLALVAIFGALAWFAVTTLRDATLSTHERVDPNSRIELVVRAHTNGAERGQSLHEMVEAQLVMCRLEVKSDLFGVVETRGDRIFRAVFRPSMDDTDKRQFRGCVEDWVIDHFQLDVVSLEEIRAR